MSRKSLPKKDTILWFLCSNCNSQIYSKDRDLHSDNCSEINVIENTKIPLIWNKQFATIFLTVKPITDDLRGIKQKYLNNFVFINEMVFSLCDLVLGDYVLISSAALPNSASIVRCVWPIIGTNAPTTISISEEELQNTWKSFVDETIIIRKLSENFSPTTSITIAPIKRDEVDKTNWNDLQKCLATQMQGNIYCKGNNVKIVFFNKIFIFTIKHIQSEHLARNEIDSLSQQLESIQISDDAKYFLVTSKTKLELAENTDRLKDETVTKAIIKKDLIGGMDEILNQLTENMNYLLFNEAINLNVYAPRSALIYGQHGCGKTLLCDALTENLNALVIKITASDVFSKYFGETETNLLSYFEKAYKHYPEPSIIVIEELSSICPKETKEDSAKRVQMAFLNILDEIHIRNDAKRLFLLTTSSNIDAVNLAVRRFGRIDCEIEIPVPDAIMREEILLKQLNQCEHNLSDDDIKTIASNSHGYIAADLINMIAKASMNASKRTLNHKLIITLSDIQYAYGQVVPSAMKEVVIKCPNVKWSDIGGQDELKLQLKQAIEWPLLHPEAFTKLGITPPRGILMFGPPGCSKTMIAKALATESKVNFLSIKGPELFSMWVGESERAVRDLFQKARQVAPAIIFFDEIDAIGGERTASASGSSVKERVLTQLLTEMDGVNALTNVTIVAATNRPDLIDKAIMRPGRLDRIVYVKLPDEKTRQEIFRIKLNKMPIADDVSLNDLVERTNGYSGAEIQAICQEAALSALEENITATCVERKHFEKSLTNVQSRTSPELLQLYDDYIKEKSLN